MSLMVSVNLSVFLDQGNFFWNQGNIREKSGNIVSNDWQKPCKRLLHDNNMLIDFHTPP